MNNDLLRVIALRSRNVAAVTAFDAEVGVKALPVKTIIRKVVREGAAFVNDFAVMLHIVELVFYHKAGAKTRFVLRRKSCIFRFDK